LISTDLQDLNMTPQKEIKVGNVSVTIYGGYREIGGNCVVVQEGDRKLIFDYGIRFDVMRRFYCDRVEPLGPVEMIKLGQLKTL